MLIRPAPVKLSKNLDNLECDRFAFVSPTTGEIREQPILPLFYGSIGGMILILFYGGYKDKKERQKLNEKRKKSKK
ncbi:MAG: hypothetical protein NZ747_07160 [Nitrosopumilus sp.]|nr:hypothetical protein [Nitrosopumilus sp.]